MLFFSESVFDEQTEHLFEVTKTKSGKVFIEGVFAQADVTNGNGRRYPLSVMKEAVDAYNETWIKESRALGEINHPEHPLPNPENASHVVESLEFDGSNVMGRARVLESMPKGKVLKSLIDEGIKIGVSTRGLGNVGKLNEVNDFKLFAVDVVSNPSAPDAFVNGIYEGKNIIIDDVVKYIKTDVSSKEFDMKAFALVSFLESM